MAESALDGLQLLPKHRRLLEKVVPILRRELGDNLVKLLLYGSVARGEATEESDVDLAAVVREPLSWQQEDRLGQKLYPAELEERTFLCVFYLTETDYERRASAGFGWCHAIRAEGVEL